MPVRLASHHLITSPHHHHHQGPNLLDHHGSPTRRVLPSHRCCSPIAFVLSSRREWQGKATSRWIDVTVSAPVSIGKPSLAWRPGAQRQITPHLWPVTHDEKNQRAGSGGGAHAVRLSYRVNAANPWSGSEHPSRPRLWVPCEDLWFPWVVRSVCRFGACFRRSTMV